MDGGAWEDIQEEMEGKAAMVVKEVDSDTLSSSPIGQVRQEGQSLSLSD